MLEIEVPAVGGGLTARMNAWCARYRGRHDLRLSSAVQDALERGGTPPLARGCSARRHDQGGHGLCPIHRRELQRRPRTGDR
jgi:hypothetical protein